MPGKGRILGCPEKCPSGMSGYRPGMAQEKSGHPTPKDGCIQFRSVNVHYLEFLYLGLLHDGRGKKFGVQLDGQASDL